MKFLSLLFLIIFIIIVNILALPFIFSGFLFGIIKESFIFGISLSKIVDKNIMEWIKK